MAEHDCSGVAKPFNLDMGITSIFVVTAVSAVGFLLPLVISRHKTAATQLAIAGSLQHAFSVAILVADVRTACQSLNPTGLVLLLSCSSSKSHDVCHAPYMLCGIEARPMFG